MWKISSTNTKRKLFTKTQRTYEFIRRYRSTHFTSGLNAYEWWNISPLSVAFTRFDALRRSPLSPHAHSHTHLRSISCWYLWPKCCRHWWQSWAHTDENSAIFVRLTITFDSPRFFHLASRSFCAVSLYFARVCVCVCAARRVWILHFMWKYHYIQLTLKGYKYSAGMARIRLRFNYTSLSYARLSLNAIFSCSSADISPIHRIARIRIRRHRQLVKLE